MVVPPKQAMDKSPWVHTVISNAKKMTAGVYHSVAKEYLQNYLNEFCWKTIVWAFNQTHLHGQCAWVLMNIGAEN